MKDTKIGTIYHLQGTIGIKGGIRLERLDYGSVAMDYGNAAMDYGNASLCNGRREEILDPL